MIPIIKNIRVVDEQGKDYGATYPKRAKGLVKHGRARFIDDNVICLACPPNTNYLEDIKMDNYINDKEFKGEYTSNPKQPDETVFDSGKYTWEYAVEQIEKIANNTEHIKEAFNSIEAIGESVDGTGSSKADAIREAIKAREETNRRLIMFYQSMYEERKPVKIQNNGRDALKQNLIDKLMSVDLGLLDNPDGFLEKIIALTESI